MNSYLRPFVESLKNLYEEGVTWIDKKSGVKHNSKVIAPVATLDAPARAEVLNLNYFNGECPCSHCEHPGEICSNGKGHSRALANLAEPPIIRSQSRMLSQALEALESSSKSKHVAGIKGPTVASLIPAIDLSNAFVPDYMYAGPLGIFKSMTDLLFCSKYKDCPWYIKKSLRKEISQELEKIAPPDYIPHIPRSLKTIKYWTASEHKMFFLVYASILLKGRMKTKYYEHLLLMIKSMRILLKDEFSIFEVNEAEKWIDMFVVQVEKEYGLEKCGFNFHSAKHLAEFARLWGAPWGTGAWTFEDFNGFIKRISHGTNKFDIEIANTIKMENAHRVLKSILEISHTKNLSSFSILGKPTKIAFSGEVERIVNNFLSENGKTLLDVKFYICMIIKNELYTSEKYKKQKKRCNYFIRYNNYEKFGKILFFLILNKHLYLVVQELIFDSHSSHRIINEASKCDLEDFFFPFRNSHCIEVIPCEELNNKVIKVQNYLCQPINSFEKK